MDHRKLTAIMLSIILLLVSLPAAAAAEAVLGPIRESGLLGRLDRAWAYLEPVEHEMKANGAEPYETVLAVYAAALNCPLVDGGSMSCLDSNGFAFTVSGMACIYDYAARNMGDRPADAGKGYRTEGVKNGPAGADVLQIMPYYLVGAAFTQELCDAEIAIGTSVAEATGGSYTLILNEEATALAIAEALPEAGVVIINCHGLSYNNTTYICLTTDEGITSLDYLNGWAADLGGANDCEVGIDGRYIKRHAPGLLRNSIIWLNMCEGMALSGCGVTPEALLEAGAGCVFGYSRNTYVRWDVLYAESFWGCMLNGATVGEAFAVMTEEVAEYIAESGAWPVLVSPQDPYPEEPDSHQTVYCDWRLFGGYEPETPEIFTLSTDVLDVQYEGISAIEFNKYPVYSQGYQLEWCTGSEAVATVSGNDCGAFVQAVSVGETTLYCDVYIGGEYRSTLTAAVRVMPTVSDALNVEGGELTFYNSSTYPWKVVSLGEGYAACSGSAGIDDSTSYIILSGSCAAGDVLTFRMRASSEPNADFYGFYVNGQLYGELLSGNTEWMTVSYVIGQDGFYTFQWKYTKNFGRGSFDDCGYLADVALVHGGMAGDVDGDNAITAGDALTVLRYSLALIGLSPAQLAAADADMNGTVNAGDALLILRKALGVI